MIAVGAVVTGKITADKNLAVGLQCHRPHSAIRAQTGIKVGIHRAVAVQTRYMIPAESVKGREVTTNDNFTIRLQSQ